jgi:hypothetical protein
MMARLRRLSAAEAVALAALTVWGIAPLVLMLRHAATTPDTFAGSDGPFPADQLQYLSWIREEGDGVLAGNAFDLAPSDAVFLHPLFLVSGLLWKLGLGLQAAYLIWKPVAIAILFGGFALFVRRTVERPRARAAALVLALFYAPIMAKLAGWIDIGSPATRGQLSELLGEAFPAGQLWGYMPTAIAVGAMPLYVLAVERVLAADGRGRRLLLAGASAAGMLAAWLHPWQGEVLVLVTLGLIAWGRLRRELLPLLVPLAATVLPLVYYLVLSRVDGSWEIASKQQELPHAPAWVLVAVILPLLPLVALGAPRRPRELSERALLLWPLAALVVYGALSPSVPAHALEGISLPLAVMSVRGWQALRLPAAAGALAVAAIAIPGAVVAAQAMRDAVDSRAQPHYLRSDEMRAMHQLHDDPRPGGVIADPALATAVPVHSGRRVWAGHPSWTRDFPVRIAAAAELFGGRLTGPRAEQLLSGSGARFALAGCGARADLRAAAPAVVTGTRRVGCATIYELRAPAG